MTLRWVRAACLAVLIGNTTILLYGCSGGGGSGSGGGETDPLPTDSPTRSPTTGPAATRTPQPTITEVPTFTFSPTPTPSNTPNQTPLPGTIVFAAAPPFPVASRPDFLATGDFNGDGRADIAVSSPRSREVSVLLSSGDPEGGFGPGAKATFGEFPGWLSVADLNQDQALDIVVADDRNRSLFLMLGNGDGTFSAPELRDVDGSPFGVAIGDFDGRDGIDLAFTDRGLNRVYILLNDGAPSPSFTSAGFYTVGVGPRDILTADLNGDDHLDLVTLNVGGSLVKDVTVLVFQEIAQEVPVFRRVANFGVGQRPSQIRSADVNGDDHLDLVMLNQPEQDAGEVMFLLGIGDGTLLQTPSLPVTCISGSGTVGCRPRALATGDFNADGSIDLGVAVFNPGAGVVADSIRVYANIGDGSFAPSGAFTTEPEAGTMVTADATGDDLPDIVLTAHGTSSVQVQLNVTQLAAPATN